MKPIDRMLLAMKQHTPPLSEAEMARRLDVSDQRFNNWKRRGSLPKDQLVPVSQQLSVRLEWLMTGSGPMKGPLTDPERDIAFEETFGSEASAAEARRAAVSGIEQRNSIDGFRRMLETMPQQPGGIMADTFSATLDLFLAGSQEHRDAFADHMADKVAEATDDPTMREHVRRIALEQIEARLGPAGETSRFIEQTAIDALQQLEHERSITLPEPERSQMLAELRLEAVAAIKANRQKEGAKPSQGGAGDSEEASSLSGNH